MMLTSLSFEEIRKCFGGKCACVCEKYGGGGLYLGIAENFDMCNKQCLEKCDFYGLECYEICSYYRIPEAGNQTSTPVNPERTYQVSSDSWCNIL